MRTVLILSCLALAACATPREACLRQATSELATLDKLILTTEANLRRGYALEREAYNASVLTFCAGKIARGTEDGVLGLNYCHETETRYRDVPTAIDPAAERRKLAELRSTRARQARAARSAVAQCEARYPAS